MLAQALSPQQQRSAEEAAARLELDELLALAGHPVDPATHPHWLPADVGVPAS